MIVGLVGPDLFPAYHRFPIALQVEGVEVVGVGLSSRQRLAGPLRKTLADWEQAASLSANDLARAATALARRRRIDRLETVDESLVVPVAQARGQLRLPGLSEKAAILCRDKTAMKAHLREAGLPCAESAAVSSPSALREFVDRVGFPIIVKPRTGMGSLGTSRIDDSAALDSLTPRLAFERGASWAVEEFVEGHEGFYDTLTVEDQPRIEFISHYFPNVLPALADRKAAPQVVATNRVELPSYAELRDLGRRAIRALGITCGATHMEWFFGPKGLKFSEIGARPPGERIWDLYCAGNDIDLYREWALALLGRPARSAPSRRFATGSVQVRPNAEGWITGYRGLRELERRYGDRIFDSQVPKLGARTVPPAKGYLGNVWFRLRHPDYDQLRQALDWIGAHVRVFASAVKPADRA